ncbi:MAG: hypothetical protein H7Y60_06510 [Rhodospirillaceae bacterium]|nr:hypothetical protein [Rhodospirillales bacterium]
MPNPSHTLITNDLVAASLGALQALPVVEPQGLTKAEAVQSMRPALEDALANRGYTHDQLAEVLTKQGLKISGATLREYLRAKPALTYAAVLALADKYQTFDTGRPNMAGIKKILPKLAGLSTKRIADAMKAAGYPVTTANVSALIKRGA